MVFDYYKSIKGINETIPTKRISVEEALEIIKSNEFKSQVDVIRQYDDKDMRKKLKEKLPYFAFSGTFKRRAVSKLIKSSGLVVLDIDEIKDMSIKDELIKNEFTHFLFMSPSGNGYKLGVKIPEVQNNVEYKQFWNPVAKHYNIPTNIDPQTSDISRACFVSHDTELYYNKDSKLFTEQDKIEYFDTISGIPLNSDIIDILVPEWKPGKRQYIALYLAAILRQKGYGTTIICSVFEQIMKKAKDNDVKERMNVIRTTFEKNESEIKGYSGLKELLPEKVFEMLCLVLNETIRKPKKEYKLFNVTSHIRLYNTLDKALGLYGSRYNIVKKLLWYSLLGNAVKENTYIDYCGTQFDTRLNTAIFAGSGSGKNDISRLYMSAVPSIHDTSDVTSLHPEQLIGKVVFKRDPETKEKVKEEIRGYFDDDIIVMDESRDFFLPTKSNSQKQQFNELRKYFCTALNPIETNLITKRLTEHKREEALKYYPKCTCCFLSQPVTISSEAITSGFMRRFNFIEIKGRNERKRIYQQRSQGVDKSPFVKELAEHFNNIVLGNHSWVFENIGEALVKYANLLCDYGINYSEKSSAFIKEIYEQSMYDLLLKYSVLASVTVKGDKKVTVDDVKVAYMDLFEILTSTFDCLENHAEDFYSNGMSYNDLLVLRWLKHRNATCRNKSSINVNTLLSVISEIYNIKITWAKTQYTKLKNKDLISVDYGKSSATVYLSEKGLNKLKIDNEIVTEDFYEEYIKICEEVKNE